MVRKRYSQETWDEFMRLTTDEGNGLAALSPAEALKRMGIPTGSLGGLRSRFSNGIHAPGQMVAVKHERANSKGDTISEPAGQSIGELAKVLNDFTENLLDLTTQMSELTRHAHGLAVLDKTLDQLESQIADASGLRESLKEAEMKLIARASVVHSND